MSYDYYGCGMYGVLLRDVIPKDIYEEMKEVASDVYCGDNSSLYDGDSLKPRFAKLEAAHPKRFAKWLEHEDMCTVILTAYETELAEHVPGFAKGRRYWGVGRPAGDVCSADLSPGDLIFGVSVYDLPLQRVYKRGRLPDEFVKVAQTYLWAEGG